MKTYKITETLYYYLDAENETEALETFNSNDFDKASASKDYIEIEEY